MFCDILENYALLPRTSSKFATESLLPQRKVVSPSKRLIFRAAMFVSGRVTAVTTPSKTPKICWFPDAFFSPFYKIGLLNSASMVCFLGAKSGSYTNPGDLFFGGGGWPHSLLGLFQEIKLPTGPTFHGPRKNLSIS